MLIDRELVDYAYLKEEDDLAEFLEENG